MPPRERGIPPTVNMSVRARRSVLYIPGANARAIEKARGLPVDGIILDLEDAVAPDAKAGAREQVARQLAAGGFGRRERVVRINGLETPWGEADLEMAARSGADAVLLPKVESVEQVLAVVSRLEAAGAPEVMQVWCMMETPRGILHAEAIAGASTRIGCLVLGTSDLTSDLRARHTADRLPLLASLSWCLLAARAHGLDALDGVHLDLGDDAGFLRACQQGVELGFDGKTLIHPRQVEAANGMFGPTPEAVAHARAVIAAFDEALEQGRGVAVLDGRLIENLHVRSARRILQRVESLG